MCHPLVVCKQPSTTGSLGPLCIVPVSRKLLVPIFPTMSITRYFPQPPNLPVLCNAVAGTLQIKCLLCHRLLREREADQKRVASVYILYPFCRLRMPSTLAPGSSLSPAPPLALLHPQRYSPSRSAHSSEQGPLYNTLSSRHQVQDFPGVPMAKNPPANAEDVGLIPGLGRFHRHSLWAAPVEPGLWSPGATAAEGTSCNYWSPKNLEPMLCNKRSHHHEKLTHCSSSSPLSPQLETAQTAKKSQRRQINR